MASDKERRDFYRIEDKVTLELTPLPHNQPSAEKDSLIEKLPQEFRSLNQIRKLEVENQQLLRHIQDKNRDIAHYLKIQNEKIEILARQLLQQSKSSYLPRTVNISGNGIRFLSETVYPVDSNWQVMLLLYPECFGIACTGKILTCEQVENDFQVALEFTHIDSSDQDELVRHITRLQSEQLRKERLEQ